MRLLNINGADYSENVIVGSYSVNSYDVCTEWTDANSITHRDKIRSKCSGSFDIEFRTMDDYNEFVERVNRGKRINGYVPCDLYINNLNQNKSCKLYISFEPSLTRVYGYKNHVPAFTVEVEER